VDEKIKAVMAGEMVKLRAQWEGEKNPAPEELKIAGSFVDYCVAHLVGGGDLGLQVNETADLRDIFG
jgi:hypothetical protein